VWNIGNVQKPRWQILSSGGSCKGHSRIVFSLSAGCEHCTTLVSVSMDRQVSLFLRLCCVSLIFNSGFSVKSYPSFIIILIAFVLCVIMFAFFYCTAWNADAV